MTRTACTEKALILFLLIFPLLASLAVPQDLERCQRCHGETWIKERTPESLAAMTRAPEGGHVLREGDDVDELFIEGETYLESAHGSVSCEQCHPGVGVLPHSQFVESVSCSECHNTQAHEVMKGLHDPDKPGTPSCTDCHGAAHEISRESGPRSHEHAVEMVERCSACHEGDGAQGFDPAQTFHDSIHGDSIYRKGLVQGPLCTDCHGSHAILSASHPESPLHVSNVSATCGSCHQGVVDVYGRSIHGQHAAEGREDAATCTSGHHSHGVDHVGPSFLSEVVAECSNCHIELGKSYLRSYHGKASELGSHDVAVCSSCHGAHDILPASNPASRVAEHNLKDTCGECHPGANGNFVGYIAHIDYVDPNAHPAVFYTFWGMTFLLLSVLAVFIPHTLLWFQRALLDRLRNPVPRVKSRIVRRFSLTHRITHGMIVVSFLGLVATGFPLKYSYTEWAHNLTAAFGGIYMMGLLHRFFAVTTLVYVIIHLVHLLKFFKKQPPKTRWSYITGPDSLMFRWKDFTDFIAMMKWFFRRGPRPRFDRWTYFEKFDYWGEIWGVIIIGGSGLLLWMPVLFTTWLPGWVLNVAMVVHSIEALLAASVIFLVHFFNTHLRPEKFPIDMTMWTGQISEHELKEERAAQYERLVQSGGIEREIVEPMSLRLRIVGVILGISAFFVGIFLIILAIRTELLNVLG